MCSQNTVPDGNQLSSGVVSSTQDEPAGSNKRQYSDEGHEAEPTEEDVSKRKKRKEEDKEPMAKPAPVARGAGRYASLSLFRRSAPTMALYR